MFSGTYHSKNDSTNFSWLDGIPDDDVLDFIPIIDLARRLFDSGVGLLALTPPQEGEGDEANAEEQPQPTDAINRRRYRRRPRNLGV